MIKKYICYYKKRKLTCIFFFLFKSKPGEVEKAVEYALDCGYRHIDTAYIYLNETGVGHGIHNWIKKAPERNRREDLFIVTKVKSGAFKQKSPRGFSKYNPSSV